MQTLGREWILEVDDPEHVDQDVGDDQVGVDSISHALQLSTFGEIGVRVFCFEFLFNIIASIRRLTNCLLEVEKDEQSDHQGDQ